MKTVTSEIIKSRRKHFGMTQRELAKKTGYVLMFISNLERGLCMIPDKKIKAFAKALWCSLDILVEAKLADYKARLYKRVGLKLR